MIRSQSKIRHIQRANLLLERRYLKEDDTTTLPQTIFWMSCDGNKNTLSPTSKESIKDTGEVKNGKKLYYFSSTPTDKGEKDQSYDVVGCVGVDACTDPKTCEYKFVIDDEGVITPADMI